MTKYTAQFKDKRTRAANGDEPKQISAKTDFQKFFDDQSEKFKLDYLGRGRYDLYKTGKLEIKDFVDIKTGREYTIEEIKKHIA